MDDIAGPPMGSGKIGLADFFRDVLLGLDFMGLVL